MARSARVGGFAGVLLLATVAQADVAPPNAHRVEYRYSIQNLAEHPELTSVAWPRSCGSDGHPLGDIDLDLNPQEQGRLKAPSPLTKVHDVLRIARVTPTELEVVPVKVVYSFDDAADEPVMYKGTARPEPSRPEAMLPLSGDAEPPAAPSASAGLTEGVGPAGAPNTERAPEPAKRGFAVLILAGALAILYFALRFKRRP